MRLSLLSGTDVFTEQLAAYGLYRHTYAHCVKSNDGLVRYESLRYTDEPIVLDWNKGEIRLEYLEASLGQQRVELNSLREAVDDPEALTLVGT